MSRFRSSADDLAYGDIPQRWDRDRFERFNARDAPPRRFEEDYRYEERDRPGRRDVAVTDRIDERGPGGSYHERDRYVEEDRFGPARPRRRTDKELFGDVDPRELASMALTPYRRKSIGRQEMDIDIERRGPPRPGLLRRQSSLDTFDRRPARYARDDPRVPPYVPVPLPIRKYEEPFEERIRYRDFIPEDYREVEIQRERSVHRHRESDARSEARSRKSKAKSVSTRRTSISSSSSETVEESEKAESIRESIAETERKIKRGKTRMPKRLVRREAIMDLGYPFDEEENFFVLRIALEKDQIDEVIKISETYKDGEKKKIYRFEEKAEDSESDLTEVPARVEHEEVTRTEWINPPTEIMARAPAVPRTERARSVRASSPSAQSSISRRTSPPRRTSPSRTVRSHRAQSRRPPSPGTFVEERRTIIEDRSAYPPPPPPGAIPMPAEPYIDHRTYISEHVVVPPPPPPGALVLREREVRSDRDVQAEIRALEAERRALRLEREAEEKRGMALPLRQHPDEDFQLVEYRERRPREVVEVVEREKSPPRNVIRVEKDRKEKRGPNPRLVAAALATLT
ncbi:hypothetical protein BAUCODRAFT_37172 [Baudoinia panamericana UAMH 10762]|uniref:DUF8035 domain-containing protein n=1 Tax=Baudoinia panamericana (strain UAMH 10762) TaxID=717646 RepID=M2MPX1_BAUPA|nr:uncharacterized protein BAUCODRAFT_37172 [Baudoinia panamericana UAMH 10762]EMC93488.1 hypothetical protein BAUCODRAFT_37172 [Baudoinia panamericana UAMH 10762]